MKPILIIVTFLLLNPILNSFGQEVQRLDELGNFISTKNKITDDYVPGEVIVKFKKGTLSDTFLEGNEVSMKSNDAKSAVVKSKQNDPNSFFTHFTNANLRKVVTKYKPSYGVSKSRKGSEVEVFDFENLTVLEVDSKLDILSLCEQISAYDEIEYAEPNYILTTDDIPANDTEYSRQRGFEQSNDADIDANHAWDYTTGNYGIKVGVIDNGVDYHNIDLGDGAFNVDGAKVRGGWDYFNNDSDPDDNDNGEDSHGTPVAGIIGALRNNNNLVAGLAGGDGNGEQGVQLFAFKVGQNRTIVTSHAVNAIIEGSTNTPSFGYGCHVLNNSWGSYNYNESVRNAVRVAVQNNVVFVASKGNDNTDDRHYPSDYDESWVISVGATDYLDRRSEWSPLQASNFGNNIDVAAPGGGIGTYSEISNVRTTGVGRTEHRSFNGTSAAGPHVAGLAALILSEAKEQGRSLHHQDVENLIEVSADDVNGGGYDDELGHGRINAGRALEMMNSPWELTHHKTTGGTTVSSTGFYNTIFSGSGPLSNAVYTVKRHEVRTTVSLPDFSNSVYVWGRGSNESSGWSAATPNYQLGFCDVPVYTNTTATLRAYVYEVYSILGQRLGWYPSTPQNVVFAYTTLGESCPDTINISEPIDANSETVLFTANNQINANNRIASNANVIYSAGNEIKLSTGFHAETGATFRTILEGCEVTTGTRIVSSKSSNEVLQVDVSDLGKDIQTLSVDEQNQIVDMYTKKVMVFPNPFQNTITITYKLKESSNVTLKIYDSQSKVVATLVDNDRNEGGRHFSNFDGSLLKPGFYYYSLTTDEYSKKGKIIKR
ncbi:S8 family serine peptidase [Aquimarina pacifica]|uniref:S8 family serine peptidase n=1 Tax=Aquimarina pacifica TaxID=1296415 RepID=UPI0004721076|nr:S8 family serine peptidase [Aquimarina pacifica]